MIEEAPGVIPTVLAVDDTPDNLALIHSLLKDSYRVAVATEGTKALRLAASEKPPDLILLDITMPGMDGYETCRALKSDPATAEIPVIFLTSRTDADDERKGLELGAVDYITKPISPAILLARVSTHLQLKRARDRLKDENELLEAEVMRRTGEVVALQDVTIQAMASLAETRDNDTGNHIRRTQFYVRALAERLRGDPRFKAALNDDKAIDLLFKSAPLHDIGKVGIPDKILLKPGKLTPEEFEVMKTHTTLGRDAIVSAERRLGLDLPFLACAKEIAYTHQEKWDGSGYPQGLSGEGIPLSGRLMAVADVYDSLIGTRIYKEGMPHEKAVAIVREGRGSHFDPDVVDAFLEIADKFEGIAARFEDRRASPASP
jgi:putative two-component system response regulator